MAVATESRQPVGPRATVYDAFRKPEDLRLRRLPRLVTSAFAMVWHAARRELTTVILLQFVAGAGVAVQLVVGSRVLASILTAERVGHGFADVVPGLVAILLVSTVVTFATMARQELQGLLVELAARHARDRITEIATAVDLEAFEDPNFHDRLQRAQAAASLRPQRLAMDLVNLSSGLIGAAGLVVALAALEPIVAPVVLAAYIPLWLAMTRNSRMMFLLMMRLTPQDRQRSYLNDVLTGKRFAQELRAFGLAPFLRRRHDELVDTRIALMRTLVRGRLRRSLVASVGTSILAGATIGLLVWLLAGGRITVAQAVAAAVAVQRLESRLDSIAFGAAMLYENALFLDDFNSFLELAPALEARRPTGAVPAPFSVLSVESVSFAYPGTDRVALDGVSLELRAGEICALVGENGSGKTTLAKLLCRLYTPTSGRILWDGVDTAACDPGGFRRQVSVIFQDFAEYFLPADTNIGVGDHLRVYDRQAVVAAAREAGADSFLAALPDGYDTMLGRQFEGGVELSVGQWQRVALARAFFRGAPFVILDEPTAALDPRAEHELFERIRAVAQGRTVLLISHRFSSVRSADRIFVLDRGSVVETGSHEQLMDLGGRYTELFTLQAAAYQADGPARARQ